MPAERVTLDGLGAALAAGASAAEPRVLLLEVGAAPAADDVAALVPDAGATADERTEEEA